MPPRPRASGLVPRTLVDDALRAYGVPADVYQEVHGRFAYTGQAHGADNGVGSHAVGFVAEGSVARSCMAARRAHSDEPLQTNGDVPQTEVASTLMGAASMQTLFSRCERLETTMQSRLDRVDGRLDALLSSLINKRSENQPRALPPSPRACASTLATGPIASQARV